jgi:hypothetical protein
MSVTARLKSLEQRKSHINQKIQEKQKSPAPDSVEIRQLKQEKLGLKDEMEQLRERQTA